jgi:endonuclease/exonuclease/phosphatase family metal-dependent hydrolase
MDGKKTALVFLFLFLCLTTQAQAENSEASVLTETKCHSLNSAYRLDYEDLKVLSNHDKFGTELAEKFSKTMNSIYCGYESSSKADLKIDQNTKRKYFRVSQWNIERGFHVEDIDMIFNSPDKYLSKYPQKNSNLKTQTQVEMRTLADTDIFILNEVDIGMQRTNYKNIAKEMARIIKGDYAFAPEFLELAPSYLNDPNLDKTKIKALHGNAVISKFPIKNVKFIRLPLCYDWFSEENKKPTALEQVRRASSKIVINEDVLTEVRQGSRIALVTEIELPNHDHVSVVSVHMENRTLPACRVKQMDVILNEIKDLKTPVILGGDFNNFEKSAEPTSATKVIKRTVSNPENFARAALNYLNPYALITNIGSFTVGNFRKYKDPTVTNIPVLLPNKSRKLFDRIEDFKFEDGNQFDMQGDKTLSYNGIKGYLSNSNQRSGKGFVDTFKFNKSYGVALYKIDWLFVKPLKKPGVTEDDFEDLKVNEKNYQPAFGQTLKELNYSKLTESISDHSPVTCKILI